ncbi:LacI family DNA-binding transcriptional regulator [Microterricola viridarii]|uniref:Transcriptional regulator, LacI family n=1 Tax=Microterricola viridarii TaxID=412690 RepID=A0A1H1MF02_9MICO|nr:LacI family DNA-binding transcriptional regulator [Microterricola viridarii]SDR85383.1 transcriptional regulator, LacI family [Microterricola viridarii]
MSLVRLRDVAQHAGVSVGTVSNVLNDVPSVNAEIAHRVRGVIQELGYVPNSTARSLRTGQSNAIGFVFTDISNPFFTTLALGASAAAAESGYSLLFATSEDDEGGESKNLDVFERHRVAGVLVTPARSAPDTARLLAQGTKVVLVDRHSDEHCSVFIDDTLGGALGAAHLIETGRRRILLVLGPDSIQQMRDREEGCREAVAAHPGVELRVLHEPTLSVAIGRSVGDAILAMPVEERPDAVFAGNDLVAIGLMQRVARVLDVPRDLAVLGYDDIDFAGASLIPISSIGQRAEHMGYVGARLLIDELGAPAGHVHQAVGLTPALLARESTVGVIR